MQSIQLTCSDGLKLNGHEWPAEAPKAVLLLIHGFGEHSGRYHHVAEYFHGKGVAMLGFDLRGHGTSQGQRGHAPNFRQVLQDADDMLAFARQRYPRVPVYLYGHSMGGNIVLSYLLQHTDIAAEGAMVTGPLVNFGFEPPAVKVFLGRLMRSIWPTLSLDAGLDTSHLSHDSAVVAAYNTDPLVHGKVTAAMGAELIDACAWLMSQRDISCPIPLLMLHGGEDLITSPTASKKLASELRGDVTYHTIPGMYHEIHNEYGQEEVFDKMWNWLEMRLV